MSNMPTTLMTDEPPYLDFKTIAKELRNETIEAGHIVYEDVAMVYITTSGDNKSLFENYVPNWLSHLKARLHDQMISEPYYDFCVASYEAWKNKQAAPVLGTPIEQWPQVSPSQVKAILNANVRTIEDLAKCNEEGLTEIGMGARALKNKAQAYIQSAQDHGKVSEKMNSLETKLETAEAINKEMLTRIAELESQSKKPGRPKKEAA